MLAAVARTALCTAASVDVDVDVLLQGVRVLETFVLGAAVGDEPGDFFALVGRPVGGDGLATHGRVEVDPFLVRCHQLAVVSVGGRPVEDVLLAHELRV